jgi:hypothetical protein
MLRLLFLSVPTLQVLTQRLLAVLALFRCWSHRGRLWTSPSNPPTTLLLLLVSSSAQLCCMCLLVALLDRWLCMYTLLGTFAAACMHISNPGMWPVRKSTIAWLQCKVCCIVLLLGRVRAGAAGVGEPETVLLVMLGGITFSEVRALCMH